MTLIEEVYKENTKIQFYEGIDFNVIMNHSKDGSDGFIYCFIDNWVEEVKKWERDSKINSIIYNQKIEEFQSENINNNWICIYQTQGTDTITLYKVIKDKVVNKNFTDHQPWVPISGFNKGGWKIGKFGISN
jgi:hypothetical protein